MKIPWSRFSRAMAWVARVLVVLIAAVGVWRLMGRVVCLMR
jgi:hypothetical protein